MKFEWPHSKICPVSSSEIVPNTSSWWEGSKYSPIYIFSEDTFKIVIDSAKNEIQTLLFSVIFRGVLWTTFYTISPWCNVIKRMKALEFFLQSAKSMQIEKESDQQSDLIGRRYSFDI